MQATLKGIATGLSVLALTIVTAQGSKVGTKAPGFSATSLDGKTVTLDGLLKDGPVVLYFIKHDCPANAEAAKHYVAVSDAYKGKSRLVGVINADKAVAEAYAKRHYAAFPILLDPDLKIIRAYKADFSPWATAVNKDGSVGKTWAGASAPHLGEINGFVASACGKDPAKIAWHGLGPKPSGG